MTKEIENILNQGFDYILDQLDHGNSIEGLKKGLFWSDFQQVKEWKSRFGYQFHIYSNDHFLDNKPHFHLIKQSEEIDCRLFFNGDIFDCKGKEKLDRKVQDAVYHFLSTPEKQNLLIDFWNKKNPRLKVSK